MDAFTLEKRWTAEDAESWWRDNPPESTTHGASLDATDPENARTLAAD